MSLAHGAGQDASLERWLRQLKVTEWLNHEAQLLDDGDFQQWLELLADDVKYTADPSDARARREPRLFTRKPEFP